MPPPHRRARRQAGLVALWVVAAGAAVTVGTVAVSSVGASLHHDGPVGEAVDEVDPSGATSPQPGSTTLERTFRGEYGALTAACHGVVASAVRAAPAAGWRTTSYEAGPDDDVGATFSRGQRSVEIEVYCNRGRPTIADLERETHPDD
ncbi:MAG: hypothetical protein QM638_05805 [Nocardioides sp.]|uniref:hypothetical protein n=1 Tax=Nocardioides sp. TaxID=35761 RepID=UPI0039E5DF48